MSRQNTNWKNQRLDVAILHKGQHVNVELGTGLRGSGWRGGTFVQYTDATAPLGNTGKFLGIVEKVPAPGTGTTAGFLIFASTTSESDDPEFFSSYKPESTGVAAINKNMGKYKFFWYERRVKADRVAGALVTYALNARLYVSDRALLTGEDENAGSGIVVGKCFHVPSGLNDRDDYVGLDVNIED